ncbi:Rho gtpase-activating protein [Thalictrum thalictroides]|uniref:Rho gtpase-activating protein n=1 Tax=Thalictrum thalictroides TaxID=46969 RepID=A0A7J6UTS1_THATH|nr:Rho gtpase-activating protein [Thalictrum thalictroides]
MTEVLHSPSHFPSSPSSLSCAPTSNDGAQTQTQTQTQQSQQPHINSNPNLSHSSSSSSSVVDDQDQEDIKDRDKEGDQLSLLALLLTVFRKSLVACRTLREEKLCSMEIGLPTNVRHVAHVTFDRFNGFLGLPVEFEPEVPRRAPSASTSVFGVSTESMQCSYDSRGNSVPTILLLMQRRLYAQGGLQAEGIFRINAENSQEEFVRDQLNRGIVPDGIDVHCLAGLIKAWFRELPSGVLDPLEPEQVMQCQSEDECAHLVRLLPPMEAALLDWAINLMADVVQEEHHNKMNARNVAMVFAPNMTQMADPLTALMYAVQVMNFLKTLIMKTVKGREDSVIESATASHPEPSGDNGDQSPSLPCMEEGSHEEEELDSVFIAEEPISESPPLSTANDSTLKGAHDSQVSDVKAIPGGSSAIDFSLAVPTQTDIMSNGAETTILNQPKPPLHHTAIRTKTGQSSNSNVRKVPGKVNGEVMLRPTVPTEKSRGTSIISRLNSRTERVEAWR